MRLYTVHGEAPRVAKPGPEGWPEPKGPPPVILRDAFSIWPFLFGPFWFLAKRLWIEAAVMLVLLLAAGFLLPEPVSSVVLFALHLIAGFEGRDRLRARLERKGMVQLGVVAAPSEDIAWFRLVQQRPDLVKSAP